MKSIGIDYGSKYIGLALGSGNIVAPIDILENRFGHKLQELAILKISKIIRDEKIELVVIGMPVSKGTESNIARDIRVFVHKLKKVIPSNIDIVFVDESYTSKIATSNAIKFDIPKKKRKDDHAIAACEILKRGLGIS